MSKKYMKAIASVLLVVAMVLQMIPSSVFVIKAADPATATSTIGEIVKDTTTGIFYKYLDISEYRVKKDDIYYSSYPEEDGYVFAGWYQEANENREVSSETTTGTAWAKFVPEDTLSVKAQTTDKMKNNPDTVKFRLVTSVDSLRYQEVGFSITINGKKEEHSSKKVFKQITAKLGDGSPIQYPKKQFCEASQYFATVKLININKETSDFDTTEYDVVPYWITKDGTKVYGVERKRMLVSDERINDEDKSVVVENGDFTKTDKTYTYKITEDSAASFHYFKGGSNTVYLRGTYKTAGTNNQFGISIRNGGETRQVFYDDYGVKVVAGGDMNASGYAGDDVDANKYAYIATADNTVSSVTGEGEDEEGVYVWVQAYEQELSDRTEENADKTKIQSVVNKMVTASEGETYDVIWAIEKNVLYGSVEGKIFLRMPMVKLCADWKDGRCYQLGVAGYNKTTVTSEMSFTQSALKFGKKAYKTTGTEGLTAETETLKTSKMAYEPIDGTYVPGSDVQENVPVYARTAPKEADTQVAVETVVENWGYTDAETGVGITITLDDGDNNSVQFEIFDNGKIYLLGEYGTTEKEQIVATKLTSTVTASVNGSEQACIKAAVYDGKFMVLIDKVPAYECSMKTLFSSYTGSENVSLGIVAHDTKKGYTPRFKEVKTYEGQDAINAKMENWTFYPDGIRQNANVEAGTFSDGGSEAFESAFLAAEENPSKVWQITGTMCHEGSVGETRQGLLIRTKEQSDYKWLYLMGGYEGIEKRLNDVYCTGDSNTCPGGHASHTEFHNSCIYNNGDNEYAFVKNSQNNGYFNIPNGNKRVKFQAVIVDDTVFMWLNEKFSWMVPLTDKNFNEFPSESDYNIKLMAGDGKLDQSFEDIQVRTGSEVDATLVKNLRACKNFGWYDAYKDAYTGQKSLRTDGAVIDLNKDSTNRSDVYSKVASDTIYVSGAYTKEVNNKAGMYSVLLKGDEKEARFFLDGKGYTIMEKVSDWDTGPRINHTEFNNNGSDPTVWAQSRFSAIEKMLDTSKGEGTVNRVEWAVSDNTLYCKVDGQISCIIPLNKVYSEWTNETKYQIALAGWNISNMGMSSISDLEVLYGEDAKQEKLPKKQLCSALTGDNKGMVYDALDDAYIPIYKEGSTAFYGAAGKNVTLTVDMQLLDKANTTGIGAGISVRLPGTDKSAEFLAVYEDSRDVGLRILKDLKWDWVKGLPWPNDFPQLENKVSSPFSDYKDGVCRMTATVNKNGTLSIYFNNQKTFESNLATYLPDYEAGNAVELGIATNNSDEGITFFKNVTYESDLAEELNGKNVSILGDGISTFTGFSNDASRNATIGNNVVEYTGTNCDVTNMYQTYWGQMLKKYNMNLLVNNSSRGNKLLNADSDSDSSIQAGYMRAEHLSVNAGIENEKKPHIILLHMGTNDYIQGKAPGEINADIRTAVVSGEGDIPPTTFTEAYVIALEKITTQYPEAEVFCFTLSPSDQNSEDKTNKFTLLGQYNTRIREIVEMYQTAGKNVTLVDTGITQNNYMDNTYDNTHPNLKGMTLMAGKLERAMFEKYVPAQSQ